MAQQYKLRDLERLDLIPGQKREVEVEGIENGKILLCNVNGKTTALGSKCTHYGAPLVKGVLTGDGRITCPWHGACFKAGTGDIENAPALDALPVFELQERDGAVYVTGEEQAIKNSRRQPNVRISACSGSERVVMVGGGSGAIGTVEALRENGFKGAITMIGSEGYLPIDRTKLSKALIADAAKVQWRDEAFYREAKIDVVMGQVVAVDFAAKTVSTQAGNSYHYTKLVLATGGSPKMLPLPGFKELQNVFLLRTIAHVKEIVNAIGEKGKKIVVIGSSFIGMEVANATAKDNQVTVVGQEKAPLERVMGEVVGRIFQKTLEKNGVKFHMEAGVKEALPSKSDPSKVGSVVLKDGTQLEADLVILGTGVSPQTSYLQGNNAINLLDDGSIQTDEAFAVSGLNDVFAIGDIATYPYHGPGGSGALTRIEHWNVAQNAGRSVANTIAKPGSKPKPFIPIFWSALGSQLRYCGNTPNGWDDVVLQGEPDDAKFTAFYCKDETVVALASMQMDPVMTAVSELMRRGAMPSKSEIQKGVNVLDVKIPAEVTI